MPHRTLLGSSLAVASAASLFAFIACSSAKRDPFDTGSDGGGFDAFGGDVTVPSAEDPITCEQAVASKSYVGCDYWPTITSNVVQSVFDFAVAVANVGTEDAEV